MSDYLFDKDGEPEAEVAELEQLLAPLAYRGAAPQLPERGVAGRGGPERGERERGVPEWRRSRRRLVVGATLSLAAAALVALVLARPWRPAPPSWAATVRGGEARREGKAVTGALRLPVGAWLDSAEARVQIVVADIGTVELAPRTRVRIVATGAAGHELELARGSLEARIAAPPRRFAVQTPRARVVDLGCAFALTVDEAGRGQLVVTGGKVAVAASAGGAAGEIEVPAGARVDLSEHGPGAPYPATDSEHAATPSPHAPSPHAPSPHAPSPHAPSPHAPSPHAPSLVAPHASTPSSHHPAHATKTRAGAPAHATTTTHATPPPNATATHAPAQPTPPARAKTPQQKPAPPAPKVEHDSLKDLQRSVE